MPKFFFSGTSKNSSYIYPKPVNLEQISAEDLRILSRIWNINTLEYEYQDFVLNSKNEFFKLPEDFRLNFSGPINYTYLILVSSEKVCTSHHIYNVIFDKNQTDPDISWETFEFTKETFFSDTVPRQLLQIKKTVDVDLQNLRDLDLKKLENGSIYRFHNVTCYILVNIKEK